MHWNAHRRQHLQTNNPRELLLYFPLIKISRWGWQKLCDIDNCLGGEKNRWRYRGHMKPAVWMVFFNPILLFTSGWLITTEDRQTPWQRHLLGDFESDGCQKKRCPQLLSGFIEWNKKLIAISLEGCSTIGPPGAESDGKTESGMERVVWNCNSIDGEKWRKNKERKMRLNKLD